MAAERRSAPLTGTEAEYPFYLGDLGFGSFDEQVSGKKTFDFNVDGLAHVGSGATR